MGVRRCLARSLTSLALLRTPKSANGPRSNSFRPDSPSTTNFPRGRKTQPAPSPHRTWSVPDASSKPQLNLHNIGSAFGQTATNDAQKRQKAPLIVVKSLLFIASRRITRDFRKNSENTLRNTTWAPVS